jgi:hypothetical protein
VAAEQHDRSALRPSNARDQRLKLDRRERPDLLARRRRHLPQRARGVAGHVPVLDSDLQDARQPRQRLAHGVRRAAVLEQELLVQRQARNVEREQRLVGELAEVVLQRPVVVLAASSARASPRTSGNRRRRTRSASASTGELAHQVRPELQRRRISRSNVSASPLRSNERERCRPFSRQRTRHLLRSRWTLIPLLLSRASLAIGARRAGRRRRTGPAAARGSRCRRAARRRGPSGCRAR